MFAPDNVLILISKLSQARQVVRYFKKLCSAIFFCFTKKVVKTTSIYMRQHVKLYFTIFTKLLRKRLCQKLFVQMQVVIIGKNNLCTPQTTSKTLLCYCSLVIEIFQQFRHTESCVRKFIFPMKYVINGKNNTSKSK